MGNKTSSFVVKGADDNISRVQSRNTHRNMSANKLALLVLVMPYRKCGIEFLRSVFFHCR